MTNRDAIFHYCLEHSTAAPPILRELERATHLHTIYPQMLAGPYQGLLLQFISRMIRPRRILEVGAFTGYSAICLAQGLPPGGILHTIEADDEYAPLFHTFIIKAGLQHCVRLHNGDAAEIIPALDEIFDLVLLDAGKLDYLRHYELTLPKLRPGGFLLADNTLWAGKVAAASAADPLSASAADPLPASAAEKDPATLALRRFNDAIHADPRVENLLLPLRDGLMLVRKRESE